MEGGPPVFTQRFTCVALLAPGRFGFRIRVCHPLWSIFPNASPIVAGPLMVGLVRVRSPLLTESRLISFPPVTEMFHFTGFAIPSLCIQEGAMGFNPIRLPHSEIVGLAGVCPLPTLIAAYHVLHRLLAPRHPLCALCNLISFSQNQFAIRFFQNGGQRTSYPLLGSRCSIGNGLPECLSLRTCYE